MTVGGSRLDLHASSFRARARPPRSPSARRKAAHANSATVAAHPRCPASMWVELPGELVKLIAQQKSVRSGTMRQVCKAWRTALVPSFAELEPYLQNVPRETLVPLMAAAWQDSPGDLRDALISACAPVWIEHAVEDVGDITERDWTTARVGPRRRRRGQAAACW